MVKHVSDMLSGKDYIVKHVQEMPNCPQTATRHVSDMLSGENYIVDSLPEMLNAL
jgi:hypothetical protein